MLYQYEDDFFAAHGVRKLKGGGGGAEVWLETEFVCEHKRTMKYTFPRCVPMRLYVTRHRS
jgi:hypothetical protein